MTSPDSPNLGRGRLCPYLVDLSLLTKESTGVAGLAPGPCLLHLPVYPALDSSISPLTQVDSMFPLPRTLIYPMTFIPMSYSHTPSAKMPVIPQTPFRLLLVFSVYQ